jgi:hypothetical protein
MFNRKTISILFAILIMASVVGCGGGGQTTITSNTGGPTGSATLAWDAPTTNVDGTPLTSLAGFKIYYGTAPGTYVHVIDVGSVTSYAINNLAVGTYYFSVTAYDYVGFESDFSNEVSKIVL